MKPRSVAKVGGGASQGRRRDVRRAMAPAYPLQCGAYAHRIPALMRTATLHLAGVVVLGISLWSAPPMAGATAGAAGPKLTCAGRVVTIAGSPNGDVIAGTPAADVIAAGGGADVLHGMNGNDVLCGGPGEDVVFGGGGVDRLLGESGSDQLRDARGEGRDRLLGGLGDDILRSAQVGKNYRSFRTLRGGPGEDRLVSAASSQGDLLLGGADSDVLVSAGYVQGEAAHYADRLSGDAGADSLRSQRGGLTDFMLIGDGDRVRVRHDPNVNRNTDYVTAPRIKYMGAPGPVVVDLAVGYGEVLGSGLRDTLLGLDDGLPMTVVVYGTREGDLLRGTDSETTSEILHGMGGDDELFGGLGNDWLLGGNGDDMLDGGAGADWGSGGDGTDTCINMEESESCA